MREGRASVCTTGNGRHCVTTRYIRRVSLLSFREQTHWIVADVSEYSDKVGLQ